MASFTQDRLPTGDGDIYGYVMTPTSNVYAVVDDPIGSPDDDTTKAVFTENTEFDPYCMFTFSPFTVPDGAIVTKLGLTFRIYTTNYYSFVGYVCPKLKVNGALYTEYGAQYASLNAWAAFTHDYTVNPATGEAWVIEDINGGGSNPLQQFGIYARIIGPGGTTARITQVYATASYTFDLIYAAGIVGPGSFHKPGFAIKIGG